MESVAKQRMIDDYHRLEKRAHEDINMWEGRMKADPQNASYFKMRLQGAREELRNVKTQMKHYGVKSEFESDSKGDFITVGEGANKHVIPRSYLK